MSDNRASDAGKAERLLAQAIVDTLREPLLVLDQDLRVIVASRSFYTKFKVERGVTEGRLLSDLGNRQWDIAPLLAVLERVAPDRSVIEGHEVALKFPTIGLRTFLLNASKLYYEDDHSTHILLAFEDVTDRLALERHRDELMRQKDLLLEEMQHRVANSLQIIASILLLKARTVPSPETRAHLEDAHKRVMSVAEVQRHLRPADGGHSVDLSSYLTELCSSLAASMINDDACSISVNVVEGRATSAAAVSIGLIATELVINSLKHAFPESKTGGLISVSYETNGDNWKLTIADNGMGKSDRTWPVPKSGLGTSIVDALAKQLDARVETQSGPSGTIVVITHSTYEPRPQAAYAPV